MFNLHDEGIKIIESNWRSNNYSWFLGVIIVHVFVI